MARLEWFGTFMCPEQTMLLYTGSLSPDSVQVIRDALERSGCQVRDNTPEIRNLYLNPNEEEHRRERYKGAFLATINVSIKQVKGEANLAIEIGWYKGLLHAKSSTTLFRWNGTHWVERDDLTIVTVS